ncbi:hypothetical protein BGZ65_007852 [Modicella reniformis]|uniref:CRAL-TRIO domain-containing protein n=1 Tax=Modicella reniformis TaxID=1440133 RepID=A0A9P6IUV8_9FUNG|nr:hypothetical protein BGZ65_007852 [Modicella reniformis]
MYSSSSSSSSSAFSTPTYIPPILRTDGRLGHLTPEQTEKLKLLWIQLFDIFDGKTPFDQSAPTSFKGQAREDDSPGAGPLQLYAWFGRWRNSSSLTQRFTGEELYNSFWKLPLLEHPDSVILKFLRARKWVLEDALTMLVSSLKWRIVERLNELTELSDVELDAKYPNFVEQMRMGKAYIRGADPLGRPICVVNARVHHKADQPPETLHRFTIHTMECGRMLTSPSPEAVIVIFDLSSFGLNNMDWAFVRLFVQCFESYYPEFLGVCVIHRAPVVFWDLWRLIQPLLDPVVASRFVFTRNNAELHRVIPRERLPIVHFDGLDDWTYEYIPPQEGENIRMQDTSTKERLLAERRTLEAGFSEATRVWMKEPGHHPSNERDHIANELRDVYSRMNPYTMARNLYHRWGVIAEDGGVNWTYNYQESSTEAN